MVTLAFHLALLENTQMTHLNHVLIALLVVTIVQAQLNVDLANLVLQNKEIYALVHLELAIHHVTLVMLLQIIVNVLHAPLENS